MKLRYKKDKKLKKTPTMAEENLVRKKQMRIKSLDPQTKVKLDSLKTVRLARRAAFDSVRQLSETKRSINIRLINERSVDRDSIFTALYSGSEGS